MRQKTTRHKQTTDNIFHLVFDPMSEPPTYKHGGVYLSQVKMIYSGGSEIALLSGNWGIIVNH